MMMMIDDDDDDGDDDDDDDEKNPSPRLIGLVWIVFSLHIAMVL